jgi:hypothetical protein
MRRSNLIRIKYPIADLGHRRCVFAITEAQMSDFSILPVALFSGMVLSFMAFMLFAVMTDRDIATD